MGMYDQIEEAAFDNYDPDNFDSDVVSSYDPDNYSGKSKTPANSIRKAKPGQKLQVNLTLSNPTANQLSFELFSALDSVTTRRKTELAVGNYAMHPANSIEGITLIAAGTGGVVGFSEVGNLSIEGAAIDPKATIGCGEYPYVSFFESSKTQPFDVAYLRFTCQTDAQIDNNITWFQRTFGGGVKQNVISPRAYFKPNQFQSRTIDVLAPFQIDGEKGLLIPINAGESVRLALFVQRWARPSL